jgi:hypothetical protein
MVLGTVEVFGRQRFLPLVRSGRAMNVCPLGASLASSAC